MKKKVCFMVWVLVFIVSLSACTKKPEPEETIRKMEEAINAYDMEKLVECYEPSVQKIYAGAVEVGNSFLGMDLGKLINAAGSLADLFGQDIIEGGLPIVDIVINSKEEISNEEVKMNLTFTIDYAGETTSETVDVTLVLIDNEWYLSADTPMLDLFE